MRWISWCRDLLASPSSANHPRRNKRKRFAEALSALKRSLELEPLERRDLLTVTVNVAVMDDVAYESPSVNSATIRVLRDGSLTNSLAVTVTFGGAAVNNVDYANLSTTVTIGAGNAYQDVNFSPNADGNPEGTNSSGYETATMTVVISGNYTVGHINTATVYIYDNSPVFGANTLTGNENPTGTVGRSIPLAPLDATAATMVNNGKSIDPFAGDFGTSLPLVLTQAMLKGLGRQEI